jgi:L,D-transpeptidase YcbB
MRRTRFERWLATTAIVAVAAGLSLPVQAAPMTDDQISAAVPMPEPAGLPPPSISDVTPQPASETSPGSPSPAQTAQPDPREPAGAGRGIAVPATAPQPVKPVAAQPDATPPAAVAPAAAAPAEPPEPTLDQRVAEKMHDMFGGKIERVIDRKNKAAVEAFYTARNFAPLWVENGAASARATAAVSYLSGVSADGLDPADYPAPNFTSSDAGALAEAELKFTSTVLTYARHAQIGRVHYSRVSPDITYDLVPPEAGAVLAKLAEASDAAAVLDGFNPPHAGYKALKAKLAEIRNRAGETAHARIPSGKSLKIGMQDPRVPMVRERLAVPGDSADTTYDKTLSDAVKAFQQQHDIRTTGVLTETTVEAINGPRRDRDADVIIANMERWRWLPRDLGRAYVMVNIPDYTLKVMDHDAMVWTTKIVAGKPGDKATPLLSETMKYITINPTWNVPPSIINNEYLPALAQDPTVLDRMGLKIEHNRDGSVHIYQPPGDGNALGRIRFNFPNKFLVYQHDTPDKHLFSQAKRAFSHGCMRVQFPDRYAEVLLDIANPKDGYTVEKIHHMYGTGERDIHLTTPIPVHITYQTAFVDDTGHLAIRDDVYGRDARLLSLLKGDDRRMADAPVEHREASVSTRRQASRMPLLPSSATPRGLFFGDLFR